MNKILIVCGGKEMIIKTKHNVLTILEIIKMNEEEDFIEVESNTFIVPHAVTVVKDITKDNDKLPFDSEKTVTLTLDGKEITSIIADKTKLSTPDMCCIGDVKPLKSSRTLNYLAKSLGEYVEYDKVTLQDSVNSNTFLLRLIYEEPADSSGQSFNCCVVKKVEKNRVVLFDGREIEIDKLRVKRIEESRMFLCKI